MELYLPTYESLKKHQIPVWFKDAKFGIFIHWGVFSVPAWAPIDDLKLDMFTRLHGNHPYAEIYMLCMKFRNSPFWKHHVETYGGNFHYDDFIPSFKAEKWDPDAWVRLFKEAGAKYTVMVTKHSDDFALWPTAYSDRNAVKQGPGRDLVGDYTMAVRRGGMRLGLYFTWAFNAYFSHYPGFPYPEYIHAQAKELIQSYQPDLFWPDAEYAIPEQRVPAETWKSKEMIAFFYNQAKDPSQVLVNDRWGREGADRILGDYMTPEYYSLEGIPEFYWETTRGIGRSFGYNQNETEKDYSTVKELVYLLVDNVSKNGNLLLNVGPKADGTIPDIQAERLRGIGQWLSINGEAIYDTRHWIIPSTGTVDGIPVRFTCKNGNLYLILLGKPTKSISIEGLYARNNSTIRLLGLDRPLTWAQHGTKINISLPENLPDSVAYSLSISPEPYCLLNSDNKPRTLKESDLQKLAFTVHW